jgi:DNA polymerase
MAPARTAEDVRVAAAACEDLDALRAAVASCHACDLCSTRTQTVFADGDGSAGVLFIGEAPGAREDEQGVPFVGPAGKLLTDIITKGMGLDRKRVAIANILKCRPPDNRDPSVEEKRTCTPWLDRQIELLAPRVLIPLGRHASNHILGSDQAMGAMRGRVHELDGGVRVVPTYHPAYLLRSPGQKKVCWEDIQLAMAELSRP